LSYYFGHPLCHKIGTIFSLVDRALFLSHSKFHQKNLEHVINVLIENGYTLDLIFNKINIRIRKLLRRKTINKLNSKNEVEDRRLMVFPYVRGISEVLCPFIDKKEYKIGYRILNRLTAFVKRHKDKNILKVNNNVVYKIFCNNCNASYVGQTKR